MRKFLLILFVVLASRESFANPIEICQVTAKVSSIEELSTFEVGSRDVPSGVNPDGAPEYSYTKVLRFEVLVAVDGGSSSAPCKLKVGDVRAVVLDSNVTKAPIKTGDELKLVRTRAAQFFEQGKLARGETWRFEN